MLRQDPENPTAASAISLPQGQGRRPREEQGRDVDGEFPRRHRTPQSTDGDAGEGSRGRVPPALPYSPLLHIPNAIPYCPMLLRFPFHISPSSSLPLFPAPVPAFLTPTSAPSCLPHFLLTVGPPFPPLHRLFFSASCSSRSLGRGREHSTGSRLRVATSSSLPDTLKVGLSPLRAPSTPAAHFQAADCTLRPICWARGRPLRGRRCSGHLPADCLRRTAAAHQRLREPRHHCHAIRPRNRPPRYVILLCLTLLPFPLLPPSRPPSSPLPRYPSSTLLTCSIPSTKLLDATAD